MKQEKYVNVAKKLIEELKRKQIMFPTPLTDIVSFFSE